MQTAIEIMNSRGLQVSDLSYRKAGELAMKNRCNYLYDAGNGNVGQAVYRTETGRVTHQVTVDAKVWIVA